MPFVKGAPKPANSGRKKRQLEIVYWPIARLKPYERNPRKNDQAVDRMVGSIKEFGFTVPVLARSSGEVVDGHLRLKAAAKLHIETLPVIVCDAWSEAQVKAFRLLVNRSVGWADWDLEALAQEFAELQEMKFDLTMTGFDTKEIDQFTLTANPAEDDVPPVPEHPTSRTGDLWLLGGHRLLCGDATSAESVERVLNGTKPFLMVTDPPYGVEYDANWRNDPAKNLKFKAKNIDYMPVAKDIEAGWAAAHALFPGSVVYVWHASSFAVEVALALRSVSFEIRAQLIWVKESYAISRGAYNFQHEPCWYAVRKGSSAHWHGDNNISTIWRVNRRDGQEQTGHSTQKPVELMRRPIMNHTVKGEAVYEPFSGSGSTLIAAEMTERVCFGLELEAKFCDVIVTRWQNLVGKSATLEGDGRTFAEIKAERQPEVVAA